MRTTIAILAVLVLVGCATGYKPDGLTGGYSETRLNENTFQVAFRGNSLTSGQKAGDFALLRCAEVTLENGFRYFGITGSKDITKSATWTSPTTTETNANVEVGTNIYGDKIEATGSSTTTTTPGQTYVFTAPGAAYRIECYANKVAGSGTLYDAQIVKTSIRAKYGLK